jgi:hypothetical protein
MEIRASDQDRQRTVAALERHTGAGRLTLDEFAQRVDAACAARTLGELGAIVGDLPLDAAHDDLGAGAGPHAGRHPELLLVFLIAAVTLLLLGGYLALSQG